MFVYAVIGILLFVALAVSMGLGMKDEEETIHIYAAYLLADNIQVFYSETEDFVEEQSAIISVTESDKVEVYSTVIPSGTNYVRIDFGAVAGNEANVTSVAYEANNQIAVMNSESIAEQLEQSVISGVSWDMSDEALQASFETEDPYWVVELQEFDSMPTEQVVETLRYIKLAVALLLALVITVFIYRYVFLKDIYAFVKDIIQNRKLLLSLAINDFKVKFAGSYFGIIWAFVQPICTIAVFWFVFEMGFRSGSVSSVPFALWLSVGLVPWFFFSDSWNGATNTFMEYSYLVKKVVFKIEILPLVKILSALFVHLFFIGFLCLLFLANGIPITVHVLGVFYYMVCLIAFVMGLSFMTSSIVVFFKDLTQIIGIVLQFGMWLTPIMWQISTFSGDIINLMRLNPMFYIIEGYRSCFISTEAVPSLNQGVYFWLITVLMFLLGIALFRRLKPHFADVL